MAKNILLFLLLWSGTTYSQSYSPTDSGSKVHFVIRNFGISTGGDFKGLKGSIFFDPEKISESKMDVTVDVKTIDTDNSSRDESLRSVDYFDAAQYPVIRIASTKIELTNKTETGYYFFTGNITIHGITRGITFPFKADKTESGYIFSASIDLNRLDFGVGEKSTVLSDKVAVNLKVNAEKK